MAELADLQRELENVKKMVAATDPTTDNRAVLLKIYSQLLEKENRLNNKIDALEGSLKMCLDSE